MIFAVTAFVVSLAATADERANAPTRATLSQFDFSESGLECPLDGKMPSGCGQFFEPAIYRGYWLVDRETSFFSFDGETPCWESHENPTRCIDLVTSGKDWTSLKDLFGCTSVNQVEFVGRRSRYREGFPAMYRVRVEKVIAAQRVETAAPDNNICGPEE